ncbi:D-alanyl-D-alanine carboxypeptidase [Methylopila sp. Yamaguchi]|uniref:D-alanyl-D-alanine carboxypeptidase n=1 Tax=Methylopila sp. Yamaguchi TaxID=1437817 RepID=UPI000CB2433B|nr:D-alanyl-D-alanine carboxypeptidase [Methylopila sp. Yamaguchi]GBD48163.1 peptidase S11 D-alanyl-D-alanine carboxypeptidase 1 [Methylopila sp. Yamaguchi]
MIASCVTGRGGRIVTGLLAATVFAGATFAGVADADARSKRKVKATSSRPAIAQSISARANYAALVVDAKTGRTLFEKNSDSLRFPASITKVMTLYLVFEDLERGRIELDGRITMSSRCSMMPPTKLGVRTGGTVRVEDGIKALVTKSANDVACAFAENLEGSEAAFAERMTRKARALGMSQSTFRNASGLPNPTHVTTARDLVTLGRAIQDRFPRYYGYFGTRVFTFAGRSMPNHNQLLGRVEGVDGIKTGYTNASGFNLLSSVKSNGRSIVAVVMGGRSGASRDAHMRELIALNMPKASPGSRTAPLVAESGERTPVRARPAVIAAIPMPIPAPVVEAAPAPAPVPVPVAAPAVPVAAPAPRVAVAAATTTPSAARIVQTERIVAPDTEPVVASSVGATTTPQTLRWVVGAPATTGSVARARELPQEASAYAETQASALPTPSPRPVRVASASNDIEGAPQVAPTAERQPVRKGWFIQIGATTAPDSAQALLSDAKSKGGRALSSAEPFTEVYAKGDTTYYRARFAGFNERSADAACKALKRSSVSCFAVKN